jgi:ABC-type phosphate transport system substrate-binding protein
MLLIRNRLLAILIVVGGTFGGTAAVATAGASAALKGAGSTLVAPLMTNWINGSKSKKASRSNTRPSAPAKASKRSAKAPSTLVLPTLR